MYLDSLPRMRARWLDLEEQVSSPEIDPCLMVARRYAILEGKLTQVVILGLKPQSSALRSALDKVDHSSNA